MSTALAGRLVTRAAAAIIAALAVAGCPDPSETTEEDAGTGPTPCSVGFLGDPAEPAAIEIIALGAGSASSVIEEGSDVPLIYPPQGGRVIFAGVRATNVDACGAKVTGVIREVSTGKIAIDARTVILKPIGDGWGASSDTDISAFANIPMCPNQSFSQDAYGSEFELEVSLKDRGGRSAKKIVRVTPQCAEPEREAACLCICKGGYVLGEMCPSEGAPL
jgi:hypothetical protein